MVAIESLESMERRVVRKTTKVTDPDKLKKFLFGDKSINLNECIEKTTEVTVSRLKRSGNRSEYIESCGYKKCSCCGDVKSIDNFYKQDKTTDGYRGTCKDCYKNNAKEYYKNKKDKDGFSKKVF